MGNHKNIRGNGRIRCFLLGVFITALSTIGFYQHTVSIQKSLLTIIELQSAEQQVTCNLTIDPIYQAALD